MSADGLLLRFVLKHNTHFPRLRTFVQEDQAPLLLLEATIADQLDYYPSSRTLSMVLENQEIARVKLGTVIYF